MISKHTCLSIIAVINVAVNAGDGFKAHDEINRKWNENYAFSAQLTMHKYIQQGLPVPPILFLPPHAAVIAQQHNARLAAQQAATPPQPNTADAELQALLQAAERLPDGCVLQ